MPRALHLECSSLMNVEGSVRATRLPGAIFVTGGLTGNLVRFYLFVGLTGFFLWLPVWVLYFQQRGMTLTQLGVLDAIGWVLMAAAEVPTGGLADRYGRKWSLAGGAVLLGFSMLAITTELFSPVFLVGWMLWGIAHTFFSGADAAYLYDTLKAEGRAGDYARFAGWSFAVLQGSQGLASLVGGWIGAFDMTLCFLIPAGLCFIAAVLATTLHEERSNLAEPRRSYWAEMTQGTLIAVSRPVVRYLVLIGASTLVFPFLLVFMLLQPYATELGVPVWALGVLVMLRGAAAVGGSMLASRAAALSGAARVLVGTQIAVVICMAALAFAPSQPILLLFVAMSFANGLLRPVLSALLNDEIPSEQRATIVSLQALLWTVFLAGVEPALFALVERTSLAFGIGVSAAALAVVAAGLLQLWRRAMLSRRVALGSI